MLLRMARPGRELNPDRSARDLFGAELRRHRERAGLSLEKLAKVIRYSRSHLARIEAAECLPPPGLAEALDAEFGTGSLFVALYKIAQREAHPDKYRRGRELEAKVRCIKEYAGCFVPGLMQTADYARALFRTGDPTRSEEKVEEMVALRMSRQALLQADRPPELSYILDEAVLRRPVGGSDIWRDQLAALAAVASSRTHLVQVLPFNHGEHPLMGGHLTLFISESGATVAYEETISTMEFLEDPIRVARHRRAYEMLSACALSPIDSAAFIKTVIEEIPR
ncbi:MULTISPECIES: helix-turn-helix domain-containing protein [Streptomyces]|nr:MULTISPECIES: helix-turn-helix transcriptional regulator [Streptomyces]MCC2279565.1 helix-turn-helix domain-containing protein [Streptomyces sp. ET3-23]GHF15933.1 transcriptional regulator [Streptomyces morookaense]